MILYHGSNVAIDVIDLSKSRPGKDFGKGFYLSAEKQQAIEMAESKVAFLGGEPIVTEFEFDSNIIASGKLNVKTFNEYSEDWASLSMTTGRTSQTKLFMIMISSTVP